jgi:exopolysaccharide biosynthesis protein
MVGDTLLVYMGTEPAVRHLRTMVGGVGVIISNGKIVPDSINVGEKTNATFLRARHPRTFVGFDKDSTMLFICVVDGRQARSLGMNFAEMAEFLMSIGAWNAVNLDGGGSTTMVVHGMIVNSPSDKTGERPVANTLQVINSRSARSIK